MTLATRQQWADAYYAQACSDWVLFRMLLQRSDVPRCHSLHYLQMATEKLSKAHRFRDPAVNEATLTTSHLGFSRYLNAFLRSDLLRDQYSGRTAQLERLQRDCNRLARAVERLAPAVDRSGHPGNAEYPWADGDAVLVPTTWSFPEITLEAPSGVHFLKVIEMAFKEYNSR